MASIERIFVVVGAVAAIASIPVLNDWWQHRDDASRAKIQDFRAKMETAFNLWVDTGDTDRLLRLFPSSALTKAELAKMSCVWSGLKQAGITISYHIESWDIESLHTDKAVVSFEFSDKVVKDGTFEQFHNKSRIQLTRVGEEWLMEDGSVVGDWASPDHPFGC